MWITANFQTSAEIDGILFGGKGRTKRAFRAWLASANTRYNIGISPNVFGYNADGSQLQRIRHIGITDYRNGVRLHAVGGDNIALIEPHFGAIQAALIADSKHAIPMQARSGQCGLELMPYGLRYYMPTVAVSKAHPEDPFLRAWKAVELAGNDPAQDANVKAHVAYILDVSLTRQFRMLGSFGELALLDNNQVVDVAMGIGERRMPAKDYQSRLGSVLSEFGHPDRVGAKTAFQVEVHSIGGATHVVASSKGHGRRAVLKHVEFSAKANMTGLWLAGRALSLGDGTVLPATRRWTQEEV